ncbi:MAG: glycine cleavage system protein GcvH [Alphaproteobacteria bacterium]|nr:glycine cleavage system protein GcvH [Alphaproteobacteria bacterium]MCB1839204.1 glycine cleavage system protein GcvH [Alphaproteobacteria bacterium]
MSALKYTKDHECILVRDDVVWIGITKYAQDALGDLVFLDLPEIGKKVAKGGDVAVVESVKTAAEVYSPVSGEVVEVNQAMAGELDLIRQPVNDNGWIVKVKVSDKAALEELMDETAYNEYLEGLS